MNSLNQNFRSLIVLTLTLLVFAGIWALPTSHAQAPVQVTAADPSAASQGTINLNVRVTGKGFKNGAKAKWFVTGSTDTGGVTVNSTTFVSSTELTANITIADTAVIANYDIQVLNSDGRGGKGTELFGVTPKGGGNASCPAMQPAPTSDTKCIGQAPGCLDSTFGGSGFVYTSLSSYSGQGTTAMTVQADSKIVVAAEVHSSSTGIDFGVLRYNPDGSLDTSFGDPDPLNPSLRLGYTVTAVTSNSDRPYAILVEADNKIVLAGQSNVVDMAAVRYNVNGSLDTSFGSGGIVRVNFASTKYAAEARGIAQQSDGKLVLGGTGGGQFAVARLNPNGSLDSSFGSSGKITVNPSGARNGSGFGRTMEIQRVPAVTGEERIVVGGVSQASSNDNWTWTLMRLRSDGSTDTGFGSAGIVKTFFSGLRDQVWTLKVDSSNRIVAAGMINGNSPCGGYVQDGALVRYTQDGALDGSFSGGKQIVDIYGGGDNVYGLYLQANGKILTVGNAYSSDIDPQFGRSALHLTLIRFNGDGTRDSSFGLLSNGLTTFDVTEFGGSLQSVAVQPIDGKIVVAGNISLDANGGRIAVGRYWP